MKNNKVFKAFLACIGAMTMITPVYAENDSDTANTYYPTIENETGTLTVKYYDDSEETKPIEGAEFTIYKVANIGRKAEDGTSGAYLYLDDSLSFTNEDGSEVTDVEKYEASVLDVYGRQAELGLIDETYSATVAVGKDGLAVFKDVPVGAYLVTETKTMRYHIRSKSFLVSVPETEENGYTWNYDVTCNPKQILAGDLEVTKKILGKDLPKKDATFTVELTLPEGEYSALLPSGKAGYVHNGDEIDIKGDQTLYVYDLPEGSEYTVKEKEANGTIDGLGFKTTYEVNSKTAEEATGKIVSYGAQKVTITNDSTDFDTGSGFYKTMWYMIAGVGAITVLIFLFATRKKKKTDETK